ncbi:MAG: hypothetical protein AAF921_10585 [Cyanobacteria bacterium P01_D01_bin.44]
MSLTRFWLLRPDGFTIAQRFQFQVLPGQQVDLYPTLTLRPKDGMKLFIIS